MSFGETIEPQPDCEKCEGGGLVYSVEGKRESGIVRCPDCFPKCVEPPEHNDSDTEQLIIKTLIRLCKNARNTGRILLIQGGEWPDKFDEEWNDLIESLKANVK